MNWREGEETARRGGPRVASPRARPILARSPAQSMIWGTKKHSARSAHLFRLGNDWPGQFPLFQTVKPPKSPIDGIAIDAFYSLYHFGRLFGLEKPLANAGGPFSGSKNQRPAWANHFQATKTRAPCGRTSFRLKKLAPHVGEPFSGPKNPRPTWADHFQTKKTRAPHGPDIFKP